MPTYAEVDALGVHVHLACGSRSAGLALSNVALAPQRATLAAACGGVRCWQRRARTVGCNACAAEVDVRRGVRRSQRRAFAVERSARVAEGDVRCSVRRSQRAVLAAPGVRRTQCWPRRVRRTLQRAAACGLRSAGRKRGTGIARGGDRHVARRLQRRMRCRTQRGAGLVDGDVRYSVPRRAVLEAPGASVAPGSQEAETVTSHGACSVGCAAERSAAPAL